MRKRLMKIVAVTVFTSLVSSSCMLSRVVDRAFVGITVRRPTYADRKTTGVLLLPLTFAVDVATFPIQAILVAILGDNFPFKDPPSQIDQVISMRENPQFMKLTEQQQKVAVNELNNLIRSGQVSANTALALTEDGHWVLVPVSDEARAQLIARAQQPAAPASQVACTQ